MTVTANVPTTHASRYLQQLCKHWSHKFETDFSPEQGVIAFPMGPIRMAAQPEALVVTLEPNADADVERFKQVVADHLDRFAFREAPLPFDWR
ncbi:DUF2218 domain-containing protein [Sphingobium sp. 3R8]|uniref:2,4-dihydroxyhept-2-ene-1,7-dioic acid aldolase n=2 Tax=Sphingomonadaceae TaxID=41297 RepID=A0A0J7XX74_9SPHN|nr:MULTISPECIES: DUF2218 domain-containing protein [Sphingomonadaceae]KMS55818.1 hypothetical protein V473_13960 [Sphingobium cupriresistens LL01]MBA4092306.1 DUF2218 domain-containing protein [Sphingobium sp.]MBZ9648064.1 DUF2218 domain-containing protein [Sphingobium sp. 3R8]BBF69151.1 hypothetical protein SBA_ch1_13510 [Sphingomonas bisphenolicum]